MRKAQSSVVGMLVIFALIFTIFPLFYFQWQLMNTEQVGYAKVKQSANIIADLIVEEGFPSDWDEDVSTVRKIGLSDGTRITNKKINSFSGIPFQKTKKLFGMPHNYMFYLEKRSGEKVTVNGYEFFGWNAGLTGGNGADEFNYFFKQVANGATHIARQEKFVLFEGRSELVKLVVFAWSDFDFIIGNTQCSDNIDNDVIPDLFCDMPFGYCKDGSARGDAGCVNMVDNNELNPWPESFWCRLNTSCYSNETTLITISKGFLGFGQHAALPSSGYEDKICCGYKNYIDICYNGSCGGGYETIVWLDKERNAHIDDGSEFPSDSPRIRMKGVYLPLTCNERDNNCDPNFTCLFSMSNLSNAHIGECSKYVKKKCCKLN